MAQPISDDARKRIEEYIRSYGGTRPPIPHLDLDPLGVPENTRVRIEQSEDARMSRD